MNIKKSIYCTVGILSLILGSIGAILPIIPTVPFVMLSAYCFAKSSTKLNNWFINTNLYKNNFEMFSNGKGMTIQTKIKIMSIVTITMAIGFIMMQNIIIGRIILLIVWIMHILIFTFKIKTFKN